jgi:Flagellar M-ring protein C-terminal
MTTHTQSILKWPLFLGIPALALLFISVYFYSPASSSLFSGLLNPLIGVGNYRLEVNKGENDRLSLALIIDEAKQPSSEKLEEIKLALRAASGFSPARGDILRVSILPFSKPILPFWGLIALFLSVLAVIFFFLTHRKKTLEKPLPFEKPLIQPKTLDDYVQEKQDIAVALLRHWLREEKTHA